MAETADIKQAIYDELAGVIDRTIATANPYNHVSPASSTREQELPSLHFEAFASPITRGLHGESYVHDVQYNANGSAEQIIYRRDYSLTTDVFTIVPEDDIRFKDELYSAVETTFSRYRMWDEPSDFHEDVVDIRTEGATNESRPDDAVRGERLRIEIEFAQYHSYDEFATMERIEQSIEHENETVNESVTTSEEY